MIPFLRFKKYRNPLAAAPLVYLALAGSLLPLPAQELTPAEQKAADLRMPSLDRSAMEPDKRRYESVDKAERNPFGMVSLPTIEAEEVEVLSAETEEMRIRRVLGNMRISGVRRRPQSEDGSSESYRVLLGSFPLEAGDRLPRLFANQSEVLLVKDIEPDKVVLVFEEKNSDLPPRTIGLAFDLRPRPDSLLLGELFGKVVPFTKNGAPALSPLELSAVEAVVEGTESAGMQSLIERSYELLGESSDASSDDPSAN